ncbi:MAG TPA: CAP domain-containing protein [Abditibacterium sp.]|jgi:uncharacterized protein YkwD
MKISLSLSLFLLGAGLGNVPAAHSQTVAEVIALSDYQVALDQIAKGQTQNARLLLENSFNKGEIAPESAVLLAYLQEKSGDRLRARQTLQGVTVPTPFTLAYLAKLGGGPTPVEIAAREQNAKENSNPARLETSDARLARLEKAMWEIVNAERFSKNLPRLAWDGRMASVARAHSAEMRDKKYFAHQSPTPGLSEPLDRYVAGIGKTPRLVAENVYRAWGGRSFLTDRDIRDAHDALMKSPGHRANILLSGPTKMGIGLAANATGDIWLTQVFAKE